MSNIRYPVCRTIVGDGQWDRVRAVCPSERTDFPECLARQADLLGLQPFVPDLARLEQAVALAQGGRRQIPETVDRITVNPALHVIRVSWRNLASLVCVGEKQSLVKPEAGEEMLLVWPDPASEEVRVEVPEEPDLLALKVVVEEVDADRVEKEAGCPAGVIDTAIRNAVRRGVLLAPDSRIRRDPDAWPASRDYDETFLVSRGFTLQWHLTQACDLHCRHCYDRSRRTVIPLERALGVLEDLRDFCSRRFVTGRVSLTGGNPLLYPHFFEVYRAASEMGFTLSILGNPASREQIERIVAIEDPYLYQVSLEGLEEYNDHIRGKGHFRSVMQFLAMLKEMEVSSMVMLTLTEGNIDQVIPLAERLEGLADDFTFNRLSMVGEGANLRLPTTARYEAFLEKFLDRAESSDLVGLKDNLINIIRRRRGQEPFGGCTGFGCGAAFNFITVLAEGEAHACRKFPSPIGNMLEEGIEGVYGSERAERYRSGCAACRECEIRPVCGGCLAVTYSHGLDPLEQKDPQCFLAGSR